MFLQTLRRRYVDIRNKFTIVKADKRFKYLITNNVQSVHMYKLQQCMWFFVHNYHFATEI
jgi:hypothetical protein